MTPPTVTPRSLLSHITTSTGRLETNGAHQFLAFLQPGQWVRNTLDIPYHPVLVHDDGGGTLKPNEILLEGIAVIDLALRISQDWEGRFELLSIAAGTLQGVAKNDQNLHPALNQLIVQTPQLGDMRTALYSDVLPHEEQNDFFAPKIGKRHLATRIGWESEIGCRRTDLELNIWHKGPLFSFILRISRAI